VLFLLAQVFPPPANAVVQNAIYILNRATGKTNYGTKSCIRNIPLLLPEFFLFPFQKVI